MRRKVIGMGWGDSLKGKEKASSREEELATMVSGPEDHLSLAEAEYMG
jgi:hypothetical protein